MGSAKKKKSRSRFSRSGKRISEDHLVAGEPFSDSVIESLPGFFFMLDEQGRYVRWNKNPETALGYSGEELAFLEASLTVSTEDRSKVRKVIAAAFREGQGSVEYELVSKDGRRPPHSGSAKRVKVGSDVYLIGLAIDISARKKAEDALRSALMEIEQLKEQLQSDYTYLKEEIKLDHGFGEIIGQSDALKYVLFKVNQIASADTTVLILGETDTGKELIARAIHDSSPRKARPLVKVNCATLHPSLIESELFGHESGAIRLLCRSAETVFSVSSSTARTEALERSLGGLLQKPPAAWQERQNR